MDWREDAACAGYIDPDAFFPEAETEREQLRLTVTARTICAMCVVSEECFNDAMKTKDIYSVAGGTVPLQRSRGQGRGSRYQRTTADEATFLWDGGLSLQHIAQAMNIQVTAIERSFQRAGKVTPWTKTGKIINHDRSTYND